MTSEDLKPFLKDFNQIEAMSYLYYIGLDFNEISKYIKEIYNYDFPYIDLNNSLNKIKKQVEEIIHNIDSSIKFKLWYNPDFDEIRLVLIKNNKKCKISFSKNELNIPSYKIYDRLFQVII